MIETMQIAILQTEQKGNINSKSCSRFACVALGKKTKLWHFPVPTSFLKLFPMFLYVPGYSHGVGGFERCKRGNGHALQMLKCSLHHWLEEACNSWCFGG